MVCVTKTLYQVLAPTYQKKGDALLQLVSESNQIFGQMIDFFLVYKSWC
jgi:hypothetical protein